MKIGIMGGTFDPIHLGHLIAADRAREAMDLHEVWFIPTFQPPHKSYPPKASPKQRLEMVQLAIDDCEHFRVKDLELLRGGISYTIDTAKELLKQYPNHEFYYIIGGDMVQYLPHWHQIEELTRLVSFIGLERAGVHIRWEELSPSIKSKVTMVPMPTIEISSTEIKERHVLNRSIRYLLPERVYQYIKENQLYES